MKQSWASGAGRTRRQLSAILLLAAALVVLPSPSAQAGSCPIFGPQDFVRGHGEPVTETATVTVSQAATYTLQLINGGLQGGEADRVANATITINGTQVVAPNEMNHGTPSLEKPVSLLAGGNPMG